MTVDYNWLDPKNRDGGGATQQPKVTPTPTAPPRPTPSAPPRPTPQPTPSPTPSRPVTPSAPPQTSPKPGATQRPGGRPSVSLDSPEYDPEPKQESMTTNAAGSSGAKSSDYYVPWPSAEAPRYQGSMLVQPSPEKWTVQRADSAWFDLTPEQQGYVTSIARSMGRRSGSALWNDVVRASAYSSVTDNPRSPFDYLNDLGSQYGGAAGEETGGGPGGRAAAYAGPVESVVMQAETDITAMAQATAQELLGRMPTDEEVQKIINRTRKAETAQPQVTSREGAARTVTQEGLTKEGRDQILRQVLMQSPDYQNYQIDSTVMDMMLNNLRRGQEVARGA